MYILIKISMILFPNCFFIFFIFNFSLLSLHPEKKFELPLTLHKFFFSTFLKTTSLFKLNTHFKLNHFQYLIFFLSHQHFIHISN